MADAPRSFFEFIQKSIFGRLTAEVMLYRQLFSKQAGDQLPKMEVFDVLKRVLAENIVIAIGRLVDSENGRGRENLSLKALGSRLLNAGETGLSSAIENWFKRHEVRIKTIQTLRNRFIGHLDAKTYLGQDAMPEISHEDVLDFFDELSHLMNQLSGSLTNSTDIYDWIGMPHGDGSTMLLMLEKGAQYQTVLPTILRDFEMPDTAYEVERGGNAGFPDW